MTLDANNPRPAALARVGGTLNGKWHIDRLIDVGGMGAVYAVTHRNGRRAAIKMLHGHLASNLEVRQRFLREGYAANRIDHPGAVAVLDDDVAEDNAPFLVMELLEGEPLSAPLSRGGGRLPAAEALGIGSQILDVLVVAHQKGVIHRDIKPANVFLTDAGHAKLLDFGLARIRDGAVSLAPTAVGIVMGTAGYLAPEQARGQPDEIDARTDLFALGAVLYRALSGRRIHEQPNMFEMMFTAMKEPAPSLALAVPEASPTLVAAVDRALAFAKEARWQSAAEMRDALHAAYREQIASAPRGSAGAAAGGGAAGGPSPRGLEDRPSLLVEVAFGGSHGDAIERERARTREVIEALSSVSVTLDPDP